MSVFCFLKRACCGCEGYVEQGGETWEQSSLGDGLGLSLPVRVLSFSVWCFSSSCKPTPSISFLFWVFVITVTADRTGGVLKRMEGEVERK